MSNEKRFKVGDEVVVTGTNSDHYFKVGTNVRIIEIDNEGYYDYECIETKGDDSWYVKDSDLSPINNPLSDRIAQLEADKAELVEAFTDVLSRFPSEFTGIYDKTIRRGILTAPISDIEQWRTLIKKHAAK